MLRKEGMEKGMKRGWRGDEEGIDCGRGCLTLVTRGQYGSKSTL